MVPYVVGDDYESLKEKEKEKEKEDKIFVHRDKEIGFWEKVNSGPAPKIIGGVLVVALVAFGIYKWKFSGSKKKEGDDKNKDFNLPDTNTSNI